MKFPIYGKIKKVPNHQSDPIRCFSTVRTKTRVSLKKTKSGTEKKRHERKKNHRSPFETFRLHQTQTVCGTRIYVKLYRSDVMCLALKKLMSSSLAMLTSLSSRWTIKCHWHGPATSPRIEVSVLALWWLQCLCNFGNLNGFLGVPNG